MKYKHHIDRVQKLQNNKGDFYPLVLRQCTNKLQYELKGLYEFDDKDVIFDTFWMLKQV